RRVRPGRRVCRRRPHRRVRAPVVGFGDAGSTVTAGRQPGHACVRRADDARTGGVTAGALALDTREGNRDRLTAHLSTGFIVSSGVLEGPLPRERGAWLLGGRTTRLDYLQQAVDRVAGTNDDDN